MRKIVPGNHPCYCVRVRRAANALTKFYDKKIETINLTISQFSLLHDIKLLETCNKSELAQYAKLDRTTIIRNLNILFKGHYIAEIPGPNNRNNLIQLTDLGESTLTEGMIFWKQAQAKIEEMIGQDDIENFTRILTNIESLV